jgi:heme-degrading monooxygenase HmoA
VRNSVDATWSVNMTVTVSVVGAPVYPPPRRELSLRRRVDSRLHADAHGQDPRPSVPLLGRSRRDESSLTALYTGATLPDAAGRGFAMPRAASSAMAKFARFSRFRYDPSQAEALDRIAQRIAPTIREQPGYQSDTMLRGDGEMAVFSLWDTRQHAEAVTAAVRDKFVAELSEAGAELAQPPETTIYQVDDNL